MNHLKPIREGAIHASPVIADELPARDHGRVMRTIEDIGAVANEAGGVRPSDSRTVHHPENAASDAHQIAVTQEGSGNQEIPVRVVQE